MKRLVTLAIALCLTLAAPALAAESSLAYDDGTGHFEYALYANQGESNVVNQLIDFSRCGYHHGGVELPEVAVVIELTPQSGDDTSYIQNAINTVSAMPPNGSGHRGAILLHTGRYQLASGLHIEASGVVLRGEGQGAFDTVLEGTSAYDYNIINLEGSPDSYTAQTGSLKRITTSYVPAGASSFNVESTSPYTVGQMIILQRTANQYWIDDLDMGQYGWTPDDYSHKYERWVTAINGNNISIVPPVVDPIQDKYGGGQIFIPKRTIPRISECGIENLRLESCYASSTDENHPWDAIYVYCAQHCWIQNVTAQFFAGSAVILSGYSRNITIEDCAFLDPKSTIDGGRRYPFLIDGGSGTATSNLVQRCYANYSRHDYVTGAYTTGPNAFVDCLGENSLLDCGTHHRWATGVLFDNISSSYMLAVENRGAEGTGHGWSGAQTLFWNCQSNKQRCDAPKGGMNFAIGVNATKTDGRIPSEPYGWWEHNNPHHYVTPRGFYYQQVYDRLGSAAVENTTGWLQRDGNIWAALSEWHGEGPLLLDLEQLSGTFYDATLDNTTSADGLPQNQWLDSDQTASPSLWMYRTDVGLTGALFQSNRSGGLGDSPILATTISGLTPNTGYEIYVLFSSLGGGAGDYACVYAGLDRYDLDYFDAQITPETAVPGQNLHEGYLGIGQTDASGNLVVYIDDYPYPPDGNHRTWYEGLVYTSTAAPAITGPDDLVLTAGQTATFHVDVSSPTPISSYVWHKSADNIPDGADPVVGGNSDTYEIPSASAADEAWYYCVVTNLGGATTSRLAKLGIRRQVAHYNLNELVSGQYADSSGENHHANPGGTVTFIPGPEPSTLNAVDISPAVGGYAHAGAWSPTLFTNQLTLSAWFKWNGPNYSSQVILAKRSSWSASEMVWQLGLNSDGRLNVKRAPDQVVNAIFLPTNEWLFVAVTFDGANATIYTVDEDSINFNTYSGPFTFGTGHNAALTIGYTPNTEYLGGALDEIQIFNYALDPKGIADLYNQVRSQSFCLDDYPMAYDYNGDCAINLEDFAALAQNWLNPYTLPDLANLLNTWLAEGLYP